MKANAGTDNKKIQLFVKKIQLFKDLVRDLRK
jgi:hypothetical protein